VSVVESVIGGGLEREGELGRERGGELGESVESELERELGESGLESTDRIGERTTERIGESRNRESAGEHPQSGNKQSLNKQTNYKGAEDCFIRAEKLGEKDAILYRAEMYRKLKRTKEAIGLYERYIEIGEKNRGAVAKYLSEYYDELNEGEKARYYRGIMKL